MANLAAEAVDAVDIAPVEMHLRMALANAPPRRWPDRDDYLAAASDGSGGAYGAQPRLRRCGCAWVLPRCPPEGQPQLLVAEWRPLPGALQNVPMAQLYALTRLLACSRSAGLRVTTDSHLCQTHISAGRRPGDGREAPYMAGCMEHQENQEDKPRREQILGVAEKQLRACLRRARQTALRSQPGRLQGALQNGGRSRASRSQ